MSRTEQMAARLRPAVLVTLMLGVAATVSDGSTVGGPRGAGSGSARLSRAADAAPVPGGPIADCPGSVSRPAPGGRSRLPRL